MIRLVVALALNHKKVIEVTIHFPFDYVNRNVNTRN